MVDENGGILKRFFVITKCVIADVFYTDTHVNER